MELPEEVAFGHYVGCGRYAHFLEEYLDTFGEERVLILFYEDFIAAPDVLLSKLLAFIGVDSSVKLDTAIRANQSGEISNSALKGIWTSTVGLRTRLRPFIPQVIRRVVGKAFLSNLERPRLEPQIRREIIELLEPDIRRLAEMTSRDLSAWLA